MVQPELSQRLSNGHSFQRSDGRAPGVQAPYVSDLVQKGRIDEIRDAKSKRDEVGMQTFDQSLLSLYESGRISLSEALRNADSHTDLAPRARLTDRHPAFGVLLTVNEGQGFPHSRKWAAVLADREMGQRQKRGDLVFRAVLDWSTRQISI